MKNKYTYRILPDEIRAFQMTKERRENIREWPQWLQDAWNKEVKIFGSLFPENYPNSDDTDRLMINTLEGVHLVDWNDYIIQDANGKLFSRKPDIFKKTYEKV